MAPRQGCPSVCARQIIISDGERLFMNVSKFAPLGDDRTFTLRLLSQLLLRVINLICPGKCPYTTKASGE